MGRLNSDGRKGHRRTSSALGDPAAGKFGTRTCPHLRSGGTPRRRRGFGSFFWILLLPPVDSGESLGPPCVSHYHLAITWRSDTFFARLVPPLTGDTTRRKIQWVSLLPNRYPPRRWNCLPSKESRSLSFCFHIKIHFLFIGLRHLSFPE